MGLIYLLIVFVFASYLGTFDLDPIQAYHPGRFLSILGQDLQKTLVEHGASAIARFAKVHSSQSQILTKTVWTAVPAYHKHARCCPSSWAT